MMLWNVSGGCCWPPRRSRLAERALHDALERVAADAAGLVANHGWPRERFMMLWNVAPWMLLSSSPITLGCNSPSCCSWTWRGGCFWPPRRSPLAWRAPPVAFIWLPAPQLDAAHVPTPRNICPECRRPLRAGGTTFERSFQNLLSEVPIGPETPAHTGGTSGALLMKGLSGPAATATKQASWGAQGRGEQAGAPLEAGLLHLVLLVLWHNVHHRAPRLLLVWEADLRCQRLDPVQLHRIDLRGRRRPSRRR